LGNTTTDYQQRQVSIELLLKMSEMSQPYELILLDLHMPDVVEFMTHHATVDSGNVVVIRYARHRGGASPPGVLGISTYLTKPITQPELLEAILMPHREQSQQVLPSLHPVPSFGSYRANILLAEDNAVNQKLAIRMLEKQGHTVTLAENGAQAIAIMEKQNFDLILMDVQMPEMGGLEATAIIRKREQGKRQTPIVAMTAYALHGDRERCLAAGMDEYLSKPIRAQQLKDMVDRFLQKNSAPNGRGNNGSRDLTIELATTFLKEVDKLIEAVGTAIGVHDGLELYNAAHVLKGLISHFSVDVGFQTTQVLELIGQQNGNFQDAEILLERLKNEIQKLLPVFNQFSHCAPT